jgi:GDP-4-dehydro-6-deoxy-D-mannose reductase
MRALVVGADGFVGAHLVAHLRERGDTVLEGLGPHSEAGEGRVPLDVRDADAVGRLVHEARPDAIYHLAAVAYGPDASRDLATAIGVTVGGTANVLEAAASLPARPVVLITGSSEVYGAPAVDRIDETVPPRPVSLYGATKLAQEAVALTFGRVRDVPVVATRSFNHIGPGQRPPFAIASFAHQLRSIAAGEAEPVLRVGNLDPSRDFSDVRDVVRAYRLLVSGGHIGEPINVASGAGRSIRSVVDALVRASGLGVSIEVDPSRVRSDDPPRIVGDAGRLQVLTGWQPSIPIEQTLADIWASATAPAPAAPG